MSLPQFALAAGSGLPAGRALPRISAVASQGALWRMGSAVRHGTGAGTAGGDCRPSLGFTAAARARKRQAHGCRRGG